MRDEAGAIALSEQGRLLLFTDIDGNPVDDPDDVTFEAFDDSRYFARAPQIGVLLRSALASPYERFLCCFTLTTWAERDGYLTVVDAARLGDAVSWHGILSDSRYGVDETFGHLAWAIRWSRDRVAEKGTEAERVAAVRALVGVVDTQYFGGRLEGMLDRSTVQQAIDLYPTIVERGIHRLTDGPRPSFDLAAQLAELVTSAVEVDEQLVVALGGNILAVDPSTSVIRRLAGIVSRGHTPASETFAEHLAAVGGEEARLAARDALGRRGR